MHANDQRTVEEPSEYPHWRKEQSHRGRLFGRAQLVGANVFYGYAYVPKRATAARRIIMELSFLLFAIPNFFRAGRPDVIVVMTTPVLLGVLARVFARLFNCPLVISVQDLQIEAAKSLGMMQDSWVLKQLEKMEVWSYRGSSLLTSISPAMVKALDRKTDNAPAAALWPNWRIQGESAPPLQASFRTKNRIPKNAKVIAYAGNIGEKQGLEALLEVASKLLDIADLQFLIIGAGAALPRLMQSASERGLHNLRFLPFLETDADYQQMLREIDASFLSQKCTDGDFYFPSKLLGIAATSQPIFVTADPQSELYQIATEGPLAYVSPYHESQLLSDQIRKWHAHSQNAPLHVYAKQQASFTEQHTRDSVLFNVFARIIRATSKN